MTKKQAAAAVRRPFDKYFYYLNSVQDPASNMAFMRQVYLDVRGHLPQALTLREDFCGTFANACAWVALSPSYKAVAVDLDPEPIAYGRAHYLPLLSPEQQARLVVHEGDVTLMSEQADIIAALNFGVCFFLTRADLSRYLRAVLASLAPGGVAVFDLLGGAFYEEDNEHEEEIEEPEAFSYFFEQSDWDPLNRIATFSIHFKRKGEPKRERVFSYPFRLWTPPELRDLLVELGFSKVQFYWEGTDEDGEGNEVWTLAERGDSCDSWGTYVAASK